MYSFIFPSDWCLWLQRDKVFRSATNNRWADEVRPEFSQWADSTINCLSRFIWRLQLITIEVIGIRSDQGHFFPPRDWIEASSLSHMFCCPLLPDDIAITNQELFCHRVQVMITCFPQELISFSFGSVLNIAFMCDCSIFIKTLDKLALLWGRCRMFSLKKKNCQHVEGSVRR